MTRRPLLTERPRPCCTGREEMPVAVSDARRELVAFLKRENPSERAQVPTRCAHQSAKETQT